MVKEAAAEFKSRIENRERAADQLLPLIKQGMPSGELMDMLGSPTAKIWNYTLFYSSALILRFNDTAKLTEVTSDVLPDSTVRDRSAPEVLAAMAQFKNQPYNRQTPAQELLPLLKQGISMEEAEEILGRPSSSSWLYSLVPNGKPSLIVRFGPDDKVLEAFIER